jgi:tetratricopeptide (TPR) repeat protein
MNVWKWFTDRTNTLRQAGDRRLVAMLYALPRDVGDLRVAQVEAAVPELLADVRAREDVWLEVFVRHWHMQHRVFYRREGERALGDAVDLMEFSHREEARGCPQSVCTVQDLAACYGIVDGPGWAQERREVSAETLARIDPSWACFDCISGEYAAALRDAGEAEEALRFLNAQRARLAAHPELGCSVDDFGAQAFTPTLLAAGRPSEALAAVDALLARPPTSRARTLYRRSLRALILTRLARFDEARAALLTPAEALEDPGVYELWSEAVERLVEVGALPNDPALGQTLAAMAASLDASGAVRGALVLASRDGALAVARGARWSAGRAVARMERLRPRLRQDLGALDLIARLRVAVHALGPSAPLPETPEEAEAFVRGVSLDAALELTAAANARWPARERSAMLYASALTQAGERHEAAEVLTRWTASHGYTRDTALLLGDLLLGLDRARFDRFAEDLARSDAPVAVRATPALFRGLAAVQQGDWAGAVAELSPLPALWPEAVRTRQALARALLYTGDAAGAQAQLDALATLAPDATQDHWDRMVAATLLGDLARVRASAAALGLSLGPGEGPVEEVWEPCVLVRDEGFAAEEYDARRIGPVTLRVTHIPAAGETPCYDDVWVFDARPRNAAPPADAAEDVRRAHRWRYTGVARLSEGRFRCVELLGGAPDDGDRDRLFDGLSALGCAYRGRLGVDYAHPTASGERVSGMHLCVAVPPELSDAALHARLTALTGGLALPLCWEALARAAGDAEAAAAHAQRAEIYTEGL